MSVPENFRAAVVPNMRAQHVITNRTLSALAPDEVAIKITATAINPADWKFRDLDSFIPAYPAILGSDAAGEVVALGSDVSDFAVGDRVFFQGTIGEGYQSSTLQQYCKMPVSLLSRTPDNISDEQAAGIQLATMAVVCGLYDSTGYGLPAPWDEGGQDVGKGKAIVIIGGSSSVGQYAIQMAQISGFDQIITNSSSTHTEYLKTLGAHIVLDRVTHSRPEDFYNALRLPLALVFDSIGNTPTMLLGVSILQLAKVPNATMIRGCGGLTEDFASLAAGTGAFTPPEVAKHCQEEPKVEIKAILGIGSLPHLRYLSEPMCKHLGGEDGYISRGLFKPNRPLIIPGGLENVEVALMRNKMGVSGEKVIIRPFDQ